jgi:hypothetical protein
MCRVLASWVEDEYRAVQEGGSYQRQVDLDDRGMFPGTLAPDGQSRPNQRAPVARNCGDRAAHR